MTDQRTRSATSVPTVDVGDEPNDQTVRTGGPDDTAEPEGQFPEPGSRRDSHPPDSDPRHETEHEGATEDEVSDRTGPGAGYDQEPEQSPDQGGVV
jgi:hypothetical protein